jgi:hypothetical protein
MSQPAVKLPVIGARPGVTVEALPGRRYVPIPVEAIDPIAVAEVVPCGGGMFRIVARIGPQWFSCKAKILRGLGIGISGTSMTRLIRGGFVEGWQVTPGVFQFNYHSFKRHEEASSDPDFWERTEPGHRFTNRQRYSQAVRG